jgi:hypothetical protein
VVVANGRKGQSCAKVDLDSSIDMFKSKKAMSN